MYRDRYSLRPGAAQVDVSRRWRAIKKSLNSARNRYVIGGVASFRSADSGVNRRRSADEGEPVASQDQSRQGGSQEAKNRCRIIRIPNSMTPK